jgi:iron complex outermembrane recepter protein
MFSNSARGPARAALWSFLSFCCSLPLASAADAPPALVEGRVVGPQGAPVAGVEVHLRGGAAEALSAVTAADGTFRIAARAPATYQVVCVIGTRVENGPQVTVGAPGTVARADVALRLGVSEEVSVTADAWTLPADLPTSASTRGREELSRQNLVNPEDALKYAPATTIRKRYIGDRNALLGGRSFGTLQPSRGLVYLDGYLLSNFLGRFDAPRWNMVTPEALERVDVLYGPFSAIHAGNSIGTTVVMTERNPRNLEWGMSLTAYAQRFGQYAESDDPTGGQASAYFGTRFANGLWGALTYNHQDSTSQPMQYFAISADASGLFPAANGAATRVSGIQYDTDPKGFTRAVFGANAGAIDHTVQDSLKLRLGYAITPTLEASALVAGWRNDTDNTDRTFLRDGSGAPVWQGRVTDGANAFSIPATAFAPSLRDETHRQLGATLKTRRPIGWNAAVIASDYRIVDDAARQANEPDPSAFAGGAGTITRRDGTGWSTFEVQGTYAPHPADFGDGRHALTFGFHRNAYTLDNLVNAAADWRTDEDALLQRYRGRTEVLAFYAQDAWALAERWKLTLGWRAERYRTWDGEQLALLPRCTVASLVTCVPHADGTFDEQVLYPERTLSGQSPKASLSWTPSERWRLRASVGRGVRFPNVEELYNGTVTATSVTLSDPSLRAERSNAAELTAETFWERHALRTTLFVDDVRDAILRQSDATVTPSITNVSNADRVRTPGVEVVWTARDVLVRGLSLEANGALARSKVVENEKDPRSVGKYWLRVPQTRASLLVAYRPTAKLMGSVGFRHQGRAYNDVYNLDVNPDVYGGVSRLNQLDLRASYKPHARLTLAAGVDNLTDGRAYQSHPFPGRTFFLEVRSSSR